ncbi:CBS domain-containing protein [Corallococcus praedator]|uniref:CBS domain-containing protein n=1 Tax=Corallococcus praedator TaxID=2316724 RepID=A0ABX9QBP2_9BACT|nr:MULTISPECIES: CBS domain-containing protein [Corallococcus]RKH22212.1 CBS domain-containing protein [Corallococcus sp. CA031C]RKH95142.1 CBS domain-containing protein [Corallococcus praedator]
MGTKDYSNGNGRHDLGRADRSTPPTDAMATHRPPDTAPPGSRERAESDVSGWNPARDEEPSERQGRFHRAAAWRLGQVRTDVDDTGTWREDREGEHGGSVGPYGRDDRDVRAATGQPPRDREERSVRSAGARDGQDVRPVAIQNPHGRDDVRSTTGQGAYGRDDRSVRPSGQVADRVMGDQELEMHPQRADYRDWDRTGYGGEEPLLRDRRPQVSREQPARSTPSPSGTTSRRRWQREPLTARDIMTRAVRTARRDSTLREVAQLMKEEDCGVVPIVDAEGRLLGLVTDRDLALRAFTGDRAVDGLRAADVMTEDIEAVLPEENLHGVIDLMGRRQVRRVPVVEPDDRLVGIIAMGDIASRADQDEELQDALERISSRRSFWSRLR